MVYDGACAFCTRCAHWLGRRGTLQVAPWQSVDLPSYGLTEEQAQASVWLVEPGRLTGAHLAIGQALVARGPWPWSSVGRLLLAPPLRWLAAPAYRWVAANRALVSRLPWPR